MNSTVLTIYIKYLITRHIKINKSKRKVLSKKKKKSIKKIEHKPDERDLYNIIV